MCSDVLVLGNCNQLTVLAAALDLKLVHEAEHRNHTRCKPDSQPLTVSL